MDLKIRTYKENDLEVCRLLWAEMVQRHRDIYNDSTIGGDDPGLEFDSHLELVGPAKIWLAESENTVVGLTALIQKNEEGEIEPVIVGKENRGKGVGEELVKHVIQEAKKLNILCLSVKPVARNREAIQFFYANGFDILGHVQMFMWLGESFPDMWKDGVQFQGMKFKY